jgi:hypothetical protein
MTERLLSDEALDQIKTELAACNHWIAYNARSNYLQKHDVYLFASREQADEFAANNISEFDDYGVVKALSLYDVSRQILHPQQLYHNLSTLDPLILN